MLAGTQNHLKTKRLMRIASVPLYHAVGMLETLWLLCQDCCDEGNIGKYTDDEIADYVGWEGEPSELIRYLVESGWVDHDDTYRLVVHDWLDNCPEYIKDRVRKRRARASQSRSQTTYDRTRPDKVGQSRTRPEMSEPVPPITTLPSSNLPSPPDVGRAADGGGFLQTWDVESTAKANLALQSVGYHRFKELVTDCRNARLTPLDVVNAVEEFEANQEKFAGPGAIKEKLLNGEWPADGVVSVQVANGRKSKASELKAAVHIDTLKMQLIRKCKLNEARNFSNEQVVAKAKELGLI